jgi:formylglycine-generating enzyme required for sulfatase activity/serine/threonine protein kinase
MSSFVRPEPGQVFAGDFKITKPLKEGGMGAVYVAEQLGTGALRALKLMHPELVANATARRRFELEARVGARIESDYVVNVIGAGVDDATGVPWLAMELLQGEDLSERLARVGMLSPAATLDVFRPLCHAVGAAHAVGIVHRDLKPENIFLAKSRRPNEPFTLKVLDFGIARMAAEAKTTATGAIGTPLWMPPEQTMLGGKITPAADVWALGLIAFRLLSGLHYWRVANSEEGSMPALMRELALEPIEPASTRAASLGCPSRLPEGFDAWFARCVVREPEERFADANAAFDALAPLLGGTATHASAPGAPGALGAFALTEPHLKPHEARTLEVIDGTPPPTRLPSLGTAPGASVTNPQPAPAGRPRWPLAFVGVVVIGGAAYALRAGLASKGPTTSTGSTSAVSSSASSASASAFEPSVVDAAELARQVASKSPLRRFVGSAFQMGSPDGGAIDERPLHAVTFPTFELQTAEVTAGEYEQCVRAKKCTPAGIGDDCNAGDPKRATHPINCVSYAQAKTYCEWLGRRLPSEDEWEFAASGKEKRSYPWGSEPPSGRVCSGRCAKRQATCEVGTFPNGDTPEGLHDMGGNVAEWTSSPYCGSYDRVDCGDAKKAVRGGGFCSDDASLVRTQVRQGYDPAQPSVNVGVRCAKTF